MMKVVLSRRAAKCLKRLNEPMKSRIKAALLNLEQEPPLGDIKQLTDRDGYRLRVGGYRVLFGISGEHIVVTDVMPRGQVYRRGE
jgi:mRNA interferase RelE/StbE